MVFWGFFYIYINLAAEHCRKEINKYTGNRCSLIIIFPVNELKVRNSDQKVESQNIDYYIYGAIYYPFKKIYRWKRLETAILIITYF